MTSEPEMRTIAADAPGPDAAPADDAATGPAAGAGTASPAGELSTAPIAPTSRLPGWAAWIIGAGLIVAAWFVALVTPGEEQAQAPFPVAAVVGEPATGRTITATITDIRRAAVVSAPDGWTAEGNWLVVDLEAAAVLSEDSGYIRHAMVEIGGVRYSASDRPNLLLNQPLAIGPSRTGSLAFELPDGLDAGAATLELASDSTDVRLDSMIVLSFDLAEVPAVETAELAETDWTNP